MPVTQLVMRGRHGREVMTTINMMDLTKILVVLASVASLVRAFKVPRPHRPDFVCQACPDFDCRACTTTTPDPSWTVHAAFRDTYAECALVQELVEKDQAGE